MPMQPQTDVVLAPETFEVIKRRMKTARRCARARAFDPSFALETPNEIGFKLTNRCDLRCAHCFQWNEHGHHRTYERGALVARGDLELAIVEKVLAATLGHRNILYFWGGEPLVYREFEALSRLLEHETAKKIMCTNGIAVQRQMDNLCRMSRHFTLMFSVEGLEPEHDQLRGKGSFARTMRNLGLLRDMQAGGHFLGTIDVACVVSDGLANHLGEFCKRMESERIDTLYINFPWFIPQSVARQVDDYFAANFAWMGSDRGALNSWHSFDYHIDPGVIESLLQEVREIKSRKWRIRIRFRPQLKESEIRDFILGTPNPYEDRSMCLGLSSRIDIQTNGSVTPCKKFPEFVVGNLQRSSLQEIWTGEAYRRFRSIHNNTVNPLCLKCEILEMTGVKG